jgi:hypothetical protein
MRACLRVGGCDDCCCHRHNHRGAFSVAGHTASGGAMEADLRIIVAALTGLLALATVSAQAAPLPPAKGTAGELGACPPIEKVAQERGSGRRNVPCNDRWGHCHSDNCSSVGSDNLYRNTAWLFIWETNPAGTVGTGSSGAD